MAKPRPLLDRLLNTPDLATVVPRLQPEVLHRVIETCGLEQCAEFVALATPAQLARILDLDVWRARTPGADEAFDADRFGVWIAVLMESGAAVAAEKLVGLDVELAIAGFARHAAVFDRAAVSSYTTLEGELVAGRAMSEGLTADIGGYVLEARRTDAWEVMIDLLAYLEAGHHAYFHRLMRGCVRLSNGAREEDASHELLEDDAQQLFDLARDRDARREQQGYAAPAEAHAFLRGARNVRLDTGGPPSNAITRAYFRAMAATPPQDAEPRDDAPDAPQPGGEASPPPASDEPDTVVAVLREAGILMPEPRALLGSGDRGASRLALVEAHLASDPSSTDALAYLANALMAGCGVQGRPFTRHEATDAAAATCNLGLENWPPQWPERDLIAAFQVGWTMLHRDVCMYAAERLIDVLAGMRCHDGDIQLPLDALRRGLIAHVRDREPWRSRTALDVILMLDAPAWAALLGLVDQCPVLHAALGASGQRARTIDAAAFEFIAQNSDIAAVRAFMASLPSALTG
jgi:hypothetical protein